jgi:hypothetical protein
MQENLHLDDKIYYEGYADGLKNATTVILDMLATVGKRGDGSTTQQKVFAIIKYCQQIQGTNGEIERQRVLELFNKSE